MNKEIKKWFIVGLGFVSERHVNSIEKLGGKIIARCDIDIDKDDFEIPFYTDYELMLDNQKADAIAICTPNYLHYSMIKEALDRDLKVLCEKPLTLDSDDISKLPNDGSVGVVLQLRDHPEVINLKKRFSDKRRNYKGSLVVKVYRDNSYWSGWKGQRCQSGGVLFNLGIHYIDLLIYLFGKDYEILKSSYSDKLATGKLDFNGSVFDYHFEIMDTNRNQDRRLEIDGEEISLSKKDNLSFEDLHTKVYENFINGKAILPEDALPSIKLVEKIIELACNYVK